MTTNASMESLLEELQRRKTHNVRCHRRALSVRFLTRFACVAQKGCASRKGKGCCGWVESEADVAWAAPKEWGAGALAQPSACSSPVWMLVQDVLVFNNTRLVRRVEALQEEIQVFVMQLNWFFLAFPTDSLSSFCASPTQAASESAATSSNWQWSWISGSPSQSKQPDPLQQAKLEIAALQVCLYCKCGCRAVLWVTVFWLQSELATKIEENELTHMKVHLDKLDDFRIVLAEHTLIHLLIDRCSKSDE
jgi:hypothetical protein